MVSPFDVFVETLQFLYEIFFSQMSCFRYISPVQNFLLSCTFIWTLFHIWCREFTLKFPYLATSCVHTHTHTHTHTRARARAREIFIISFIYTY